MRNTLSPDLPAIVNHEWTIGIVASTYHKDIVDKLVLAATKTLVDSGIPPGNIARHDVPGSFEIPLAGSALAREKKADAMIAFGIIVEGETHHASLLAENVARGIMDVQVRYAIPFAFEVLYVKNIEDAAKRAEGESNKGFEAARAVLWALHALEHIQRDQ